MLTKDNNVFVVDKIIKFTNVKLKLNVIMVNHCEKGLKSGDKVLKSPKGNLNDGEK